MVNIIVLFFLALAICAMFYAIICLASIKKDSQFLPKTNYEVYSAHSVSAFWNLVNLVHSKLNESNN